MFCPTVCDVRGVLRAGKNEVRVVIASPTRFAAAEAKRHGYRVHTAEKFHWQTGESRDVYRAWIRKAQCQFGWDWGLCLPTSGLWGEVRLECADTPRIASLVTRQTHRGPADAPTRVTLDFEVRLHSPSADDGEIVIRCAGHETRTAARLKRGENVVRARMHVSGPELWWPSGHGKPVLYDLEAQWVAADGSAGESLVRRIGLRTVELVTRKDRSTDGQRGESFAFRVNGRMVYAKGANWIPVDQYVERCTPEVYEHLLRSAAEANMNMIRVWGGGWYEKEVFYELCDELGLMVWQDFMMACALYPDTRDFIAEIEREARYQVRRLADHPCIALWCGDNENAEGVVAWWKRQPHAERNPAIYAKVMTALRNVAEAEDPTRRFWLSSPSNDELGDAHPSDPTRGDVHYWAVWHGGKPFENYLEVKPRFASEFGFQSFPEERSVREVVSKGARNPSSWVMEHHQRSGNGNVLITNTMARELPIPRDFEAFCWLSQVNQAQAIRTAVEHWRRLKPWCMGAIFWQINDIWPVASWSSIDYRGRWKVLQHFSRRFFAPVLASFERSGGELGVWVTSDVNDVLRIEGTVSSYTWDGARVASIPVKGKLGAGESRALGRVPIDRLVRGRHPREICCFAELETPVGMAQNHAALVPLKWAALARPALSSSLREGRGGRLELVVKSSTVTPFFHAELAGLEGHFEDDWQVLRPGRRYVFGWVPHVEHGGVTPSLTEARRRLETLTLHDLFVS